MANSAQAIKRARQAENSRQLNASQRYASDAQGSAAWRRACVAADVPLQTFVGNNAVPCGSTIGPITAADYIAGSG